MADRRVGGEASTSFADARPKFLQVTTWSGLPGFRRTRSGSTRWNARPDVVTYTHDLLPGWEYARGELPELIQDLRNVAAGLGQPTEATRPADRSDPPKPSKPPARGAASRKRQARPKPPEQPKLL